MVRTNPKVDQSEGALLVQAVALLGNIRLGLPRTNTLAYYKYLRITSVKSFRTLGPGGNVISFYNLPSDTNTLAYLSRLSIKRSYNITLCINNLKNVGISCLSKVRIFGNVIFSWDKLWLTNKKLGPYSQHFIFFVTFELAE